MRGFRDQFAAFFHRWGHETVNVSPGQKTGGSAGGQNVYFRRKEPRSISASIGAGASPVVA